MQKTEHQHIYDAQGRQLCCTKEERIYVRAGARKLIESDACCASSHTTSEEHDHHGHSHDHDHSGELHLGFKLFAPAVLSFVLLLSGILFDYLFHFIWFDGWLRIVWYLAAYIPVGVPVLKEAYESILKKDVFSEFFLMGIATIGAFAIGEYPEGVAVMLFYSIGEIFQTLAVSRAKNNIRSLIDQRPDEVTVLRDSRPVRIKAVDARIDDIIRLKPGEKIALDGILLSERASFDTAALTGESKPDTKYSGEKVLAGMVNGNTPTEIRVTTEYNNSKLSEILEMVQEATARKAPTELFIRKFARVYTPAVVALALLICFVPYLFVSEYHFSDWLYRALIFLVVSCPCALVISIPLGYFGGIGAASRNGILVRGSNFLDSIAQVKNVVMDKTGTLTEGVFKVKEFVLNPGYDKSEILELVNVLETHSTHPVATAIHEYAGEINHNLILKSVEEIPGHGLRAFYKEMELLAGNFRLMDKFGIAYDKVLDESAYTTIAISLDGKFAGYLTIADKIKEGAKEAVAELEKLGVNSTMLSGDKSAVVRQVAGELGITHAFGDLLPKEKVRKVEELKSRNESVAFVGDGVNDAPVIAVSHVGMAMGGLGSDAAVETADIVIQDDMPEKIPMAIRIGRQTKRIVWQNIGLAFVVKVFVLILGAGGIATMWEAVFADVGVALLAILNAVRIQKMEF